MARGVAGMTGVLGLVITAGLASAAAAAMKPTKGAFTRTFDGANSVRWTGTITR